jgi:hypothetical protein
MHYRKILSFCNFCINTWYEWGFAEIRNDMLYITTECSKWKVNLTDYSRFGKYTLFHYNKDNSGSWHMQYRYKDILCLIAEACAHDFHKYNNLTFNTADRDYLFTNFQRECNNE